LLVAPILDDTEERLVYLPHGDWVDYWSQRTSNGGRWLSVMAPLDTLPIYVRAGAIIPYGPKMQHVGERSLDPLTLEIYAPSSSGQYVIHEEEGPDIPLAYERDDDHLTVSLGAAPGRVEIILVGQSKVIHDGPTPATITLPLNGGSK
jgi:alpha-glucosidase (family GH31 glycosyl hydrolase)